jgi:hypothetical protein
MDEVNGEGAQGNIPMNPTINQPAPAAAIPEQPQPRLTKNSDARKALLVQFELKRKQWVQRKTKNNMMTV